MGSIRETYELIGSSEIKYPIIHNNICQSEKFNPLQIILPAAKRIIVIGDLHGDLKITLKCLKIANIINDSCDWIAEPNTVVVQIGDQIDSCRPINGEKNCNDILIDNDSGDDILILNLFTLLKNQAKQKDPNSDVISLLGNHELMNIVENLDYVSYENLQKFKKHDNDDINTLIYRRQKFFKKGTSQSPPGKGAKFLACTRQTSVIIGSNLFVHADIISGLPQLLETSNYNKNIIFIKLNDIIQRWILGQTTDSEKFKLQQLLNTNKKGISPFWGRYLGTLDPELSINDVKCNDVNESLFNFDIKNIIIGHTPQDDIGINLTCGHIWRVDVGMSQAFDIFDGQKNKNIGRKAQVLEIIDDKKFRIIREI